MPDSNIDLSDVAELGPDFFSNATLKLPEPKKAISLRLDSDILEWYRKQGTGYQTMMNAVLRVYMQGKREKENKISRRNRSLNRTA